MKLILDLSTSKLSRVSLIKDGTVVAQKTGSDTLRLVDEILKENRLTLSQIEEIDSYPGPGSFTGLKVGAAIANALNYASGRSKRVKPIFEART